MLCNWLLWSLHSERQLMADKLQSDAAVHSVAQIVRHISWHYSALLQCEQARPNRPKKRSLRRFSALSSQSGCHLVWCCHLFFERLCFPSIHTFTRLYVLMGVARRCVDWLSTGSEKSPIFRMISSSSILKHRECRVLHRERGRVVKWWAESSGSGGGSVWRYFSTRWRYVHVFKSIAAGVDSIRGQRKAGREKSKTTYHISFFPLFSTAVRVNCVEMWKKPCQRLVVLFNAGWLNHYRRKQAEKMFTYVLPYVVWY